MKGKFRPNRSEPFDRKLYAHLECIHSISESKACVLRSPTECQSVEGQINNKGEAVLD